MYFDKRGRRIGLTKWCELMQDGEYKRVALDTLKNGKAVSTVWLGIDHAFGPGKKQIFETMIFPGGEYCERYATLKEAKAGHLKAIEQATKRDD